jgi:hypothetical protein
VNQGEAYYAYSSRAGGMKTKVHDNDHLMRYDVHDNDHLMRYDGS